MNQKRGSWPSISLCFHTGKASINHRGGVEAQGASAGTEDALQCSLHDTQRSGGCRGVEWRTNTKSWEQKRHGRTDLRIERWKRHRSKDDSDRETEGGRRRLTRLWFNYRAPSSERERHWWPWLLANKKEATDVSGFSIKNMFDTWWLVHLKTNVNTH